MNFIDELIKTHDLNKDEVESAYADYLIKEKGLPKESKTAIVGLGDFGRMETNANEISQAIESSEKETLKQTIDTHLSRGAKIAKEQNDREQKRKNDSSGLWGGQDDER